MADNLIYPTSQKLMMIEQDLLPVMVENDPVFSIMPMQNEDDDILRWEQKDNFKGLQQIRGLNGDPPRIARIGGKSFVAQPGYYGEFGVVDEREITKRRKWGTFGEPIDIEEPVLEIQAQLLQRRLNRVRRIAWNLLVNGTFSVSTREGVILHTDTYSLQTYTALVAWGTVATARPLADLRLMKLLSRGSSIVFDAQSRIYANASTINNVLQNQNAVDLYGQRVGGGNTVNTVMAANAIFLSNDLPQLVPYDEGFIDDSGTFQLFIPNGVAIGVGRRTNGAALGAYRMTRNAQNPGAAPGPYTQVIDNLGRGVPRQIEVHDGHNGGPVLWYPSAIVRMAV